MRGDFREYVLGFGRQLDEVFNKPTNLTPAEADRLFIDYIWSELILQYIAGVEAETAAEVFGTSLGLTRRKPVN